MAAWTNGTDGRLGASDLVKPIDLVVLQNAINRRRLLEYQDEVAFTGINSGSYIDDSKVAELHSWISNTVQPLIDGLAIS